MTESFAVSYPGSSAGRWGHYAPQLLSGAILVAIALGIRPMDPSPVYTLGTVGVLVFVLVTWLFMRQHDRRLCEKCAASMPLNAAESAARHQRRFWVAHAGNRPMIVIPYLVVLIGSNFLLSAPGRIVWAVVQLSMIYLILSYTSHRKLQPWCPWCSSGGGGADDDVDVPDLPRGDRQLI